MCLRQLSPPRDTLFPVPAPVADLATDHPAVEFVRPAADGLVALAFGFIQPAESQQTSCETVITIRLVAGTVAEGAPSFHGLLQVAADLGDPRESRQRETIRGGPSQPFPHQGFGFVVAFQRG